MRSNCEAGVTPETTGLMFRSMPEASFEIGPCLDWPDENLWGGSTVLADGQLHAKGLRPDQVSECRRRKHKLADVDNIRITRGQMTRILYIAPEATHLNRVVHRYSVRGTAFSCRVPSCPTMLSMATYH